ncbi:MAG: hypothetical protein NZM00_05720 [Anaerolinea sp.]|nr:hypothetical protein [Anaerolinea sp.]
MRIHRTSIWTVLFGLVTVIFVGVSRSASAQTVPVCQQIIDEAIQSIGVNCANNEVGFACYASPELTSVVIEGFDETLFDEPGERIDVNDLVRLSSEASNRIDRTWGIAVYNLQASLPSGFPEDVIVMVFGETQFEHGVRDELLFVPLEEPLTATTTAASELRLATLTPPALAELAGNAPAGSSVQIDAISQDGNWVRGIFAGDPVWFRASAFNSGDLAGLPILPEGHFSPYQRFYTMTGSRSDCAETQSLVLVQGPRDTAVDLLPNGIHVRLESTMLIRTFELGFPMGRTMEIIVLNGVVTINPDTARPIYVPAGHRIRIGLGPDLVSLGNEGDADERSGPYTFNDPTILDQAALTALNLLSRIPSNITNYTIQLPQIILASGIGGPIPQIIFPNPQAATIIQRYCNENRLPAAICRTFGF